MSVTWKTMTSKFPGKCKGCNKPIAKGETINWSPSFGAYHESCEIKVNGRSIEELEREWDEQHKNDMTPLERFEEMRVSKEYANVSEDDIWMYATQDSPRNPYRGMSKKYNGPSYVDCQEHGRVKSTRWEGQDVCPYHQRVKQTSEGPVLMYEEFDEEGNER